MKNLVVAAALILSAQISHALEIGDNAPCVVVNQIAPTNTEAEHCIRDPNIKGQVIVQEFFSVTCFGLLRKFWTCQPSRFGAWSKGYFPLDFS